MQFLKEFRAVGTGARHSARGGRIAPQGFGRSVDSIPIGPGKQKLCKSSPLLKPV